MYAANSRISYLKDLDRPLLGLYLALVAIGWLMIYAVNFSQDEWYAFIDLNHNAGKQLMFMVLCSAMIFVILLTDWAFWRTFAFLIYIISIVLLIGPIFLGREVNGAQAWYQLGGFTFQPSEIAKFGACLAMASYLSGTGVSLREWRNRLTAIAIFMAPVLIIILQKDTGSALVFFSFFLVLYREGFPAGWYILGIGTAALVILGLAFEPVHVIALLVLGFAAWMISRLKTPRNWWIALALITPVSLWWDTLLTWGGSLAGADMQPVLEIRYLRIIPGAVLLLLAFFPNYLRKPVFIQRRLQLGLALLAMAIGLVKGANFACFSLLAPHQQQRIMVWLKPSEYADARGSAYNMMHSKMAIGSGGFAGKGFLKGNMTKLKYVPEQSTDFIFCTIGEEQGFLGVAGIVILFTLLLFRITTIAERQRSNFSRVYAYGVAGILFFHILINIGMTMGLFPIIGIPLPLISYGGSSLIGFSLMIGLLLKLDSHRNQA